LETIVSPVRERDRAKVPAHFLHFPHCARATAQLQFYNYSLQVQFTSFAQPQGKCLLLFHGCPGRAGERSRNLLISFIFSFHHFTAEPQQAETITVAAKERRENKRKAKRSRFSTPSWANIF
jgi:hypothetical protein